MLRGLTRVVFFHSRLCLGSSPSQVARSSSSAARPASTPSPPAISSPTPPSQPPSLPTPPHASGAPTHRLSPSRSEFIRPSPAAAAVRDQQALYGAHLYASTVTASLAPSVRPFAAASPAQATSAAAVPRRPGVRSSPTAEATPAAPIGYTHSRHGNSGASEGDARPAPAEAPGSSPSDAAADMLASAARAHSPPQPQPPPPQQQQQRQQPQQQQNAVPSPERRASPSQSTRPSAAAAGAPEQPAGGPCPPHLEGREFFHLARQRLSYDRFSRFLGAIKALNARQQDRDETLRQAAAIFRDDHPDLFVAFQNLLAL